MTEARVRVTLDTRRAKSDLREITSTAATAAGKVGGGLRRTVGAGLRTVGLGAGVGLGIGALQSAASSSLGDVIGEGLGGYGAQLETAIFGGAGEEARAAKTAREETKQAFARLAGLRGQIPPEAAHFFQSRFQIHNEEERGRKLFESDQRFRGVDAADLATKLARSLGGWFRDNLSGGPAAFDRHQIKGR